MNELLISSNMGNGIVESDGKHPGESSPRQPAVVENDSGLKKSACFDIFMVKWRR